MAQYDGYKPNVAGLKRGISDSTKPHMWDRSWEAKHNEDNALRDKFLIKAYRAKMGRKGA